MTSTAELAGWLATERPAVDLAAAEVAAGAFLAALGVSLDSEHMQETPRRMARAYAELLAVEEFSPTSFAAEGYVGLVLLRKIRFASLCAHHALPFIGSADIGYLPGERIIGLSKLARLVAAVASVPQVQERMTVQIADYLEHELQPQGLAVRLKATHLCLVARGARARGAVMVTAEVHGRIADDPAMRAEWLHGVSSPLADREA